MMKNKKQIKKEDEKKEKEDETEPQELAKEIQKFEEASEQMKILNQKQSSVMELLKTLEQDVLDEQNSQIDKILPTRMQPSRFMVNKNSMQKNATAMTDKPKKEDSK